VIDSSIRVGVIGLGRAFTLMLGTFQRDPRVKLVAACDPIAVARDQFVRDFAGRVYVDAAALCADAEVELVYVASPHQLHAEHVAVAAGAGKHVLVEKPMAITLADCTAMIDAMAAAKRRLIVGHSHSFDGPVLKARALIDAGVIGPVRMIQTLNFTDFLYRPRRPEELNTALGGGVIYSQAAHQIDVVRLLGGGLVSSVRAHVGRWDRARPTEGAYSALLGFEGGAFASLTYSGYGHFDSDAWMDDTGELGAKKDVAQYGLARRRLATFANAADETAAKAARNYGGAADVTRSASTLAAVAHQHFGPVIVCGERGDLRLTPDGVWVYGDTERHFAAVPLSSVPRIEVIDELWATLRDGAAPLHDGAWARATVEVSLALLQSSLQQTDSALRHQVPWRR
jgi:phthalate 4,5-cis-dihydrodiol dehydrogenase